MKIFRKGKTNKIKTLPCEDRSESWIHEKLFSLLSPSTGDLHNPALYQAIGMILHLYMTWHVPGPCVVTDRG